MGTVFSMMDRLVVVRDENQRIAEEMALSALIWSEQKADKIAPSRHRFCPKITLG